MALTAAEHFGVIVRRSTRFSGRCRFRTNVKRPKGSNPVTTSFPSKVLRLAYLGIHHLAVFSATLHTIIVFSFPSPRSEGLIIMTSLHTASTPRDGSTPRGVLYPACESPQTTVDIKLGEAGIKREQMARPSARTAPRALDTCRHTSHHD